MVLTLLSSKTLILNFLFFNIKSCVQLKSYSYPQIYKTHHCGAALVSECRRGRKEGTPKSPLAPPSPKVPGKRTGPKARRMGVWGPRLEGWVGGAQGRVQGRSLKQQISHCQGHSDPHGACYRFLGCAHRGFYLAHLRCEPSNMLVKKTPGDPDTGGPHTTLKKMLDQLQNAKQS